MGVRGGGDFSWLCAVFLAALVWPLRFSTPPRAPKAVAGLNLLPFPNVFLNSPLYSDHCWAHRRLFDRKYNTEKSRATIARSLVAIRVNDRDHVDKKKFSAQKKSFWKKKKKKKKKKK